MLFIARWLINSIALILVTYLVPGVEIKNFYTALVAALFLGIFNAILKPILIFLTLPINLLTLGFFTLIINGFLFWFVSSFIKGFEISGFWPAFWAAIIYSLITWLINSLMTPAAKDQYINKS